MNKSAYLTLLAVLALGLGYIDAAPNSTDAGSANRILMIDPSSMRVDTGKVTLTIGSLRRVGGVYSGDYRIQVFPYFFKHEKGRLAIVVSDESMAELTGGRVAAIIGTATTSGKRGQSRHIDATATPVDVNHGMLKLWFMSGDRKMVFMPAYHFTMKLAADVASPRVETNLASNISHGKQ
jgi:hypothetical protein